ncbi:ABC-2 type transport system ATP-binding protein [Actinopolyspora xinjiangensis]|uniref:ABC-2 type transport system ATP-binding protein n=1 Tax=Actinopolyspora xinjiangensis TaxID=405564 RepID=A0A1H0NUT8_9ACTN|nr:ABC transporter ATP-binding protein [Actinopolyspora xinjiangensis]SDO96296.1 ABC-2 type transport system ATP-binding protein [Actinopolyspora xinjiangensis]
MVTVRVDGLRARYGGKLVLDGINLHMGTGIHGLLGPNGAGKTTLMRTLATVARPSEGSVELLGHDTAEQDGRKRARRRLGYLPQTFGYYPGFTVAEFVEYMAWLKQMPKDRVPEAVGRAIERVGLADRADSKLRRLSGGMLRRAGIAQAIVNDPELLLLDEPTAGLDPEQRVDFRELLRDIGSTSTVVVSTHLVEDVAVVCDEVTLLDGGKLIFRGTPNELAESGTSEAEDARGGDTALERGYTAALRGSRERRAA